MERKASGRTHRESQFVERIQERETSREQTFYPVHEKSILSEQSLQSALVGFSTKT